MEKQAKLKIHGIKIKKIRGHSQKNEFNSVAISNKIKKSFGPNNLKPNKRKKI